MISIPRFSQAAPAQQAAPAGAGSPQGHWATQKSLQGGLDRTRATADMFSGGLQGLQGVGQVLGDAGKGFFAIAADLRKKDDYNIEAAAAESYQNKLLGYETFKRENPNSPDEWMAEGDRLMTEYRSEVLEQDMPGYLRDKIGHAQRMNTARFKAGLSADYGKHIDEEASIRYASGLKGLADNGEVDVIPGYIDNAVNRGIISYEDGEAQKRVFIKQATESMAWRHISEDPIMAQEALHDGAYKDLDPKQQLRLESGARSARNNDEADLYKDIRFNIEDYTDEGMLDLLEQKRISPEFYADWQTAHTQGELTDKEYASYSDVILSYDQAADTSNAGRMRLESMLLMVKARGDDAAHKALDDLLGSVTKTSTSSPPEVSMANKMVDTIVDATTINVTDEDALLGAIQRKAEVKKAARDFYENATVKPGFNEMREFVDEQFNQPIRKSSPRLPTPAPTKKQATPTTASLSVADAAFTDADVVTSKAGFKVDSRTRDLIGLKSKPGARQGSLDYNDAKGRASYVTIVYPDDASQEEIAISEEYTSQTTAFFAKYGHKTTNKGPISRKKNGRGTRGRFHTEPFFVGDAKARKIIEEHPEEYARILANTLGRIKGMTFIAPHTSKDTGAGRGSFTERSFAQDVLLPELKKL